MVYVVLIMCLQRNSLGCGYTGCIWWQIFIRTTSTEIGRSRKNKQADLNLRVLLQHMRPGCAMSNGFSD